MDNRLLEIYDYKYTDEESRIGVGYISKTIQDNIESIVAPLYLNPNEEEFIDSLIYYIVSTTTVSGRTVNIDYRLLTDEAIEALKEIYKTGRLYGIRLIPSGAKLTKELFDKFNTAEFSSFRIAADEIDERINDDFPYCEIINQKGKVAFEEITYFEGTTLINHHNIHITRELTEKELEYVAELIKEKQINNIIVDFYEPTYYKKLVTTLNSLSIPKTVRYRLLANPLYDTPSIYDELKEVSQNEISIFYHTCNDLNDLYRRGTNNEGENYYSDIEASGTTSLDNYAEMVKMMDEIVEHMDKMGYSPLEKIAYVYDYFKKHYIYDPNHETEAHENNADLDKVFARDRMVCEGFSNLMSAILRRAGVLCFTYGTNDHQKNIVRVVDEKYGVDNIATLDITWDLSEKDGSNTNNFNNFLLSLDNALYYDDGEVINIPTSFFISEETYEKYIKRSNPVYATDPMGYGMRMLQLMGLTHDETKEFASEQEKRIFYRDALQNSGLTKLIPSERIAEAVTAVRNKEGRYGYNGIARAVQDRQEIIIENNLKGNGVKIKPKIRLLTDPDSDVIETAEVPVYKTPKESESRFVVTESQNKKLTYPRKQLDGEPKEEYDAYLHRFYHDRFMNASNRFGDESVMPLQADEMEDSVQDALESVALETPTDTVEKAPEKVKKPIDSSEIAAAVSEALASVEVEPETKAEPLKSEDMEDPIADALDQIILEQEAKTEKAPSTLKSAEMADAVADALASVEVEPDVKEETEEPLKAEDMEDSIAAALDQIILEQEAKTEKAPSTLTSDQMADAVADALASVEVKPEVEETEKPLKAEDMEDSIADALASVEVKPEVEETEEPLKAEDMEDPIADALDQIILEQEAKTEKAPSTLTSDQMADAVADALASVEVEPETKAEPLKAEDMEDPIADALDQIILEQEAKAEKKPADENTDEEDDEKLPIEVRVPQEIIPVETQKTPSKPVDEEPAEETETRKPADETTAEEDEELPVEVRVPEEITPEEPQKTPSKPVDEELAEETETREPVEETENTGYKPMTAEEIEAARKNIDYDKYEDLYNRSKDEFLPGTNVLKPRDKYEGESDEDYQRYVREYMEHHFPVDQPQEYIPGTNILKPRNRGLYETEEEYEAYLRMYYDEVFRNKEPEQVAEENNDYETVTLYVDENTELFYVRNYVAERYELHSASFPATIDGALCYRISREDARRLVEGGESNITPYRVRMELFQRVYDRTDEEYNSFDNQSSVRR